MTTDLSVSEMTRKTYNIVYNNEYTDSAAVSISAEINNLKKVLNDNYIDVGTTYGNSNEATDYEIVIGNTNRVDPEYPKGISELEPDKYAITCYPKKIYLHAGSNYALQAAIIELESMIKNGTVESVSGVYSEAALNNGYKLVWASEFNDPDTVTYGSDGIVTSIKGGWTVDGISVNTDTTTDSNGNKHRRFGTSYLVSDRDTLCVENGSLIMRAMKINDPANHYNYSNSTGWDDGILYKHQAGIKNNMRFNYGYLEMRAKIPSYAGVYNSFWLDGLYNKSTPSVEIDIFESNGNKNLLQSNVHWWSLESAATNATGGNKLFFNHMYNYWKNTKAYSISYDNGTAFASNLSSNGYTDLAEYYKTPSPRYTTYNGVNLSDEYHTIGLYWTREKIEFLLDGKEYTKQDIKGFNYPDGTFAFDDQFQRIIASLNVGWYGRTTPNDEIFENGPIEYHIDYIRLYQIDGQSIKY